MLEEGHNFHAKKKENLMNEQGNVRMTNAELFKAENEQAVLDALQTLGKATLKDLAHAAQLVESACHRVLSEMISDGRVVRSGDDLTEGALYELRQVPDEKSQFVVYKKWSRKPAAEKRV